MTETRTAAPQPGPAWAPAHEAHYTTFAALTVQWLADRLLAASTALPYGAGALQPQPVELVVEPAQGLDLSLSLCVVRRAYDPGYQLAAAHCYVTQRDTYPGIDRQAATAAAREWLREIAAEAFDYATLAARARSAPDTPAPSAQ